MKEVSRGQAHGETRALVPQSVAGVIVSSLTAEQPFS